MRNYLHEQKPDNSQKAFNTEWPLMNATGIDIDDCKKYIKHRGLSWELAEENGWYPSRKAMDNFLRIVIPALTTQKNHAYWQARAVSNNVYLRYQTPKGPRHGALIQVRALPDDECTHSVVIVEGPMDALAVAACGYDSIALMGMAPGEDALEHLVKLVAKRPALIVLDNEPEAQSAAHTITMRLASTGSKAHCSKLYYVKDLAMMVFQARQVWLDQQMDNL